MKSGYVYCLRFRSTQFYVGSSSNPIQRLQAHRQSCLGKKQINKFMSNVWKKYGEPELYILAKVPLDLLLEEEQKFIDLVFGKEGCLNLNPKADRPPSWKDKKRGSCSPETKSKLSIALKGKKRSAETIKKMEERKHSEETKIKMSISLKDKPKSAEHKAKLSANQLERSAKAKAVIGIKGNETIEFPSVRQAAEFIGRDHKGIVRAIKCGGNHTCAGYIWRYK